VSGTDSPYRETSNITDGSAFTAGEEDSEGFQNTSKLIAQGFRKENILVWETGLDLGVILGRTFAIIM
jgi:urocanate hydratase